MDCVKTNARLLRNFIESFLIPDISRARIEAYGSKALINCCSWLRREAFIYKSSADEGGGDFHSSRGVSSFFCQETAGFGCTRETEQQAKAQWNMTSLVWVAICYS